MHTTTSLLKIGLTVVASAALFACSNGNGSAPLVDNTGKHPADWITQHKVAYQNSLNGVSSSCAECHGADWAGGVSGVSCMSASPVNGFSCHATSPADTPSGCTSCHGAAPAGPSGTTAPNRQFAHDVHTPVPGTTCSSCHNGLGYGTANHGNGTHVVSMVAVLQAKTSTPAGSTISYDPATHTCANVSCHGGQTTPNWQTGAITLGQDCQKCHEQGTAPATPQYNSYYSGTFSGTIPATNLHAFHMNNLVPVVGPIANLRPVFCTDCHNIGVLTDVQKHFSGITTNTFTAPANTVGGAPTMIQSYIPATKTCSNVSCHTFPDVSWVQ